MTERLADRCIVIDPPTEPIRITLFEADGNATAVTVDAIRATLIAGDLLIAARRRLPAQVGDHAEAPRALLPNRRFSAKHRIELGGITFFVDIGHDASHRPREVFITGGKEGTDLQLLVQHVSIVLSIALQHGAKPADLAKTLARGDDLNAWAGLLVPAVVDLLVAEAA